MFDKVVTHLLTQNQKALNNNGSCQYLTEGGLSCAVGCLIPEDNYKSDFEGRGLYDLIFRFSPTEIFGERLYKGQYNLLEALQEVHDDNETYHWFCLLETLAETTGLNFNPPKEV